MSVSDIHWGSKFTRAKRLCMALDNFESDELVGVGDIIDGIALMKKKTYQFGPWHRQGMARVLQKAATGTKTSIIDGNHEEDLGKLLGDGKRIYDVNFMTRGEHTDPKGRRFLVVHGDDWDLEVFKTAEQQEFWYNVGDSALALGYHVNSVIHKVPLFEKFSVTASSKRMIKGIINSKMGVNDAIARDLDASDYDGVLYGHSHMKGFQRTPQDKLMINDGCCTEHVQFAVHDKNGNWGVIEYHRDRMDVEMENGQEYKVYWKDLGLSHFGQDPKMLDNEFTDKTDRLLRIAYRLWPPKERAALREEIERKEWQADLYRQMVESGAEIPMNLHRTFLQAQAELPDLMRKFRQIPIPRNYVEQKDEPLLAIA